MVKPKRLGLVGLIVAGIVAIVGGAKAGILDIQNDTYWGANTKQYVRMRDNDTDLRYMEPRPGPALISYIYDTNSPDGPLLKGKGINSRNTNAVKIWFESRDIPFNADHFLQLNIFSSGGLPADMNDYATRNITLYQEPNNPGADPNLYDIKDLTNWGTEYGYVNFPTFEPAQWIFRSDNYADLDFSGRVNLLNLTDFS